MVLKNETQNETRPLNPGNVHQNDCFQYLNIVFIGFLKNSSSKFTLRVLPVNQEIVRSLKDITWLRDNLSIEFPFYYVQ